MIRCALACVVVVVAVGCGVDARKGDGVVGQAICPTHPEQCAGKCCGAVCQDVTHDPRNCGGCGTRCPDGAGCANGQCMCNGQPCAPMVDPTAAGTPPPGFCTCADGCAADATRSCIAMDCCYAEYGAGRCMPSTTCGAWVYK